MTAELALSLPVLVLVLVLALWAISAAGAAMACADAARAGARAIARGEDPGAVGALVRQVGPRGATASSSADGSLVTVRVRVRVAAPGGLPLPSLTVAGRAVAEREGASGEAPGAVPEPAGVRSVR